MDRHRTHSVARETRETRITLDLDLDGAGRFDVRVPIMFLGHMVETLARFGGFDLRLEASGDNDHHIIEDVAITLGKSFREALRAAGPASASIRRIGNAVVPMDDALVAVYVDLVERPYAEVALPDGMYRHFLRSFAMEARITLHNEVLRGADEHHIVEACFKALGLALRDALAPVRTVGSSTKGEPSWGRRAAAKKPATRRGKGKRR